MKRKELATNQKNASSKFLDSDFGAIASHIFGQESLKSIFKTDHVSPEITQKIILQNTNIWVQKILDDIEPSIEESDVDLRAGRLGLAEVRFDSTTQMGTMVMSPNRLHAQAQSNFSSVKANVCLYSGKWQYELQLESKGVMQLGWAMGEGEFTAESGVGDSVYSYAFDGNRVRKWNLITTEYGEAWQVGDIIGCTIDLDVGSIHFYRNGKDLGEAFSSISLGPGCVYYPAISLAFEEKINANFGSLPFKNPIEPYQPIQKPPIGTVLRANQLLHWLFRITSVPKIKLSSKEKTSNTTISNPSSDCASLLFSEILINNLSYLLIKPYVIEACVVPFLHDITTVAVDSSSPLEKLNFLCDYFALLIQPEDFKELINAICKCLIDRFSQTPVSLDYNEQKNSLDIFRDICQNNYTRKMLLKQPSFVKTRVPQFMELKPIDVTALKSLVSEAWWHSEIKAKENREDYDDKKSKYIKNCSIIKTKTSNLEILQEKLLMLLLNNNDGTSTDASSRKYFLHMFRLFLRDNHLSGLVSFFLNNQSAEQIPLPIALCLFHRLVDCVRALWEKELPKRPVCVPASVFYNGSIDYFSIDRLGGVLSHLVHTLHDPLVEQLGATHRIFRNSQDTAGQEARPSVQVQLRGIDANTGVVSSLTRWIHVGLPGSLTTATDEVVVVHPEPLSSEASFIELLDGLVLLYNTAAHKQLERISLMRDDMEKYVTALNEAKDRLKVAKETCPEAAEQIKLSIQAFERKLDEQSQVLMAWVHGAVYTPEKRANLLWLVKAVLLTLELATQQGELFAFIPDFYIETLVETSVAVRCYFSPTLPVEECIGFKELSVQVAEFLVKHLVDPRIVNLGTKDTIVEALASFIARKETMECLEAISLASQQRFVELLLKPYDNRPWGQTNWILLRMWQGNGFAFRHIRSPHLSRKLGPRTPSSESGLLIHKAFPPCPSSQYLGLVAKFLTEDQNMAAEFLNSVIKQLNWSFSEFISMMQEIQNLSKRPERVIIDARQLKICATCFDFVIGLLRVLEMVCTICPVIFTDMSQDGTENLLERLCQLLSQILLRTTTPTGCFAHVISLEVPDLDTIDQFPLLIAVIGVILALLDDDVAEKDKSVNVQEISPQAKCLLSEPAFHIDSIKYCLGEQENSQEIKDRFSFAEFPSAVNEAELNSVRRLIMFLTSCQARLSVSKDVVDDEELCPICCAMPLAVTFMPCHHRSCKSCITHHLMDTRECFFCKSPIQSVTTTEGKLLFDANTCHKVASDIDLLHN